MNHTQDGRPITTSVYYSPDYVAARHAFDTTRKSASIAESLTTHPLGSVALVPPTPLSRADLETVHDPGYVHAVERGDPVGRASTSGFPWDPGVRTAVRASNGGMVDAAIEALATGRHTGTLSSGLHHARFDYGAGFCTFNGLALAAHRALARHARVLIVDVDAHGGGGTYSLVHGWLNLVHVDLVVAPCDIYTPTAPHALEVVKTAAAYLPTLRRLLAALDGHFDLMIYNAGMDPLEGSDIGGLRGITASVIAEREAAVYDWAAQHQVPVAFALAGGYSGDELPIDALVDAHRLTIAAADRSH